MTTEPVIPKVEPRLQGFKLKEIFFKHLQINEIKRKPSWYEIKAIGKIHTIITALCWYIMKNIKESKNY